MFGPVFAEEIRRRIASPVTWILWLGLAVYTAATMLGGQAEELAGGGVPHNGAFVVYYWCMYAGFWVAVLGPAMFAHPLLRDAKLRILPLIASKPISATSYFWGKYAACIIVGVLILLSIPLSMAALPGIAALFGQGGLSLLSHTPGIPIVLGTLVWVLPAIFIYGSLHFAFVALTGRVFLSYAFAVLSMAVFTMFFVSFQSDSAHHFWIEVIDPMGKQTMDGQALYWTVPERASHLLEMTPALILNRLAYLAAAAVVLAVAAVRFRFSVFLFRKERGANRRPAATAEKAPSTFVWSSLADARGVRGAWSAMRLSFYLGWQNYLATWHSSVLRAILAALVMIAVTAGWGATVPTYNTPDHQLLPAAQYLLSYVQPQMFLLLVMVMIYYAGELVARDTDTRFAAIIDATPAATQVMAAGRWLAVLLLAVTICLLPAVSVFILQVLSGSIERAPLLFARSAFLQVLPYLVAFGSLTFGIYGVTGNRLVAQGLPMVLLWTSVALHESGAVEQLMTLLATPPDMLFADMGILDTSTYRHLLFATYYLGLTAVVAMLGAMAWRRGAAQPLRSRLRAGLRPVPVAVALACLLLVAGAGIAIRHALYVEGGTETLTEGYDEAADYEKRFGAIAELPQPTITRLDLQLQVQPAQRMYSYKLRWRLANLTDTPIRAIWLNLPEDGILDGVSIDGGKGRLGLTDARQRMMEIRLSKPLLPKADIEMVLALTVRHRGFTYDKFAGLLERESGLLSQADLPVIGYDRGHELDLKVQRAARGLGPRRPIPSDGEHFVGNAGRVDMTLAVSAPASLTVEATGNLASQSTRDGVVRRVFVSRDAPLRFRVVVGKLTQTARDRAGMTIAYYPIHDADLNFITAQAKQLTQRLADRFGPSPYHTIKIAEVGQFAVGDAPLEPDAAGNLVIIPERFGWLQDIRHPQARAYLTFTLGRQLAKAWWGEAVASRAGPGAALLDDGVPILLGLEAVAASQGEKAAQDYAKVLSDRYRLMAARSDASRSALLATQFEDYADLQAGLALFDRRQTLGTERFNRALDAFFRKHSGGVPINPADLARALALPQ